MADHTLDGPGGGELTLPEGDRIIKCDGSGKWIVWSENGGDLVILDKKDGPGSLELHEFRSVTIKNKKDGDGALLVDKDCALFSANEINGGGVTFLRNAGAKRIATKDGPGNVYFLGKPPIVGAKNGSGTIAREAAFERAEEPSSFDAALVRAAATPVLFDEEWSANVAGVRVLVQLLIALKKNRFEFRVMADVMGVRIAQDFVIGGDESVSIPLPYIGSLVLSVSGWSRTDSQVGFDLSISLAPLIPFIAPVPIARQHIILPIQRGSGFMLSSAQLSPSDWIALVQLGTVVDQPSARSDRDIGGALVPIHSDGPRSRDLPPGVELLANGEYWFGPNWREDHPVDPSEFSGRGGARWGNAEVYLEPGGQGNARFERWSSEDPTDLRFFFHVGSPFVGGGGKVKWNVYGTPQPWAGQRAQSRPQGSRAQTNDNHVEGADNGSSRTDQQSR